MRDTALGHLQMPSAAKIRDSARELFKEHTFSDVTITDVARRSGVNEVTVYRIFGSRDVLAAACWATNLDTLDRGIRRDRTRFHEPTEQIGSHLRRLARTAAADRQLTYAMIQAVEWATMNTGSKIGSLDPRQIVPLPQLCVPLVSAAQDAGTVRDDYPAFDLAAFLTNNLLLRFMSRPDDSASAVSDFTVDLMYRGVLVESR